MEESRKSFEYALPLKTIIAGGIIPNSGGKHYEYHIDCVLGQGGFGFTYKVWAIIPSGKIDVKVNFAIKEHFVKGRCHRANDGRTVEYSKEAASDVEDSLKDFIKEGRLLQKISSTNITASKFQEGAKHIVPVNEVIETNNTAYFVMQYLEGGSLRDKVMTAGSGLGEELTLSLIKPILTAVSYIHSHGILHMDIKPENIVMRRNLETMVEEPVLIDFGVSLHFDKKGGLTTTHTSIGRTDGFSPIEQYADIDSFQPKIDVYAMGATLFYLLVGKVPPTAFNVSPGYIERSLPENVSRQTRKAILHAMAKDAEHRTPSAEEFLSELEVRTTLPVGYILHSPNANYLVAAIHKVTPYYIIYDTVAYYGGALKLNDSNQTKTTQYHLYEYFVKGKSVRNDDESVNIGENVGYEGFLTTVKKTGGLQTLNECVKIGNYLQRELFEANGTTYAIIDKRYKPIPPVIRFIKRLGNQIRSHSKQIGLTIAAVIAILIAYIIISQLPNLTANSQKDDTVQVTDSASKPEPKKNNPNEDTDSDDSELSPVPSITEKPEAKEQKEKPNQTQENSTTVQSNNTTSNSSPVTLKESDSSIFEKAKQNSDWKTIRALAKKGYTPACGALARRYVGMQASSENHCRAYYWANKSSSADRSYVLGILEKYGFLVNGEPVATCDNISY